jgi:uncharacterized protein (TIGR03437 family)
MRHRWILITIISNLTAGAPAVSAQPAVDAVLNGASFSATVSPGCLVSIFGNGLAVDRVEAIGLPLPRRLGATSVIVENHEIPLYFISPGQINAQLPFGITKSSVSLVVRTAAGSSAPYAVNLLPAAPGIFTQSMTGSGPALAFDADWQPLKTVGKGPFIVYATGLGATDPPGIAGDPGATAVPPQRVVDLPEIYVGDLQAEVDYAGLAPGFAGVYQLNVRPRATPMTNQMFIRVSGAKSNIVEIPLPAPSSLRYHPTPMRSRWECSPPSFEGEARP